MRFKTVLMFLITTLILSGCGVKIGNKVTCSSNNDSNGIKIVQKYSISYSKDVITNIIVNKSYAFDNKEKFELFGTIINNTIANMKEIENDYIKFSSSKTNKKYSTKLTVDMKKVKSDELAKLGLNIKVSELRTQLEGQGLICK